MAPCCHLCGGELRPVAGFAEFIQVTSDSRPWRTGGRLCVCVTCRTVQKVTDAAWQIACDEIYAGYVVYQESGGHEQLVFDQRNGAAASRSQRLVARLSEACVLTEGGRLLDIGCGNGPFLAAFGAAKPGWRLTGADITETNRARIEALPGVEQYYCGDVADLAGQFDVIVMIHCLEHIPHPALFLRHIVKSLDAAGLLMIEVPDLVANPFDLLIADHATHFTLATLPPAVEAGGFGIELVSDEWVAKELSLVARRVPPAALASWPEALDDPALAAKAIGWLQQFLALAKAEARPVAIFGTSIAGTWLAAQLGQQAWCFLDEDPHRINKMHLGLPVLAPLAAPEGTVVLAPFPPMIARDIAGRLPWLRFRSLS